MVCPKSLAELDTGSYEVVKREAFARDTSQPAMTFDYSRKGSVTFSKGCLDALDDPEYVLPLINPEKKIFILSRWHKIRRRERAPKGYKVVKNEEGVYIQTECLSFLSKLAAIMDWETGKECRIQIYGKRTDKDMVVFNLAEAHMYRVRADGSEAEDLTGKCAAVETAAS